MFNAADFQQIAETLLGQSNLNVQSVLNKQQNNRNSMRSIILFYKKLTVLGAIFADVKSLYPSITQADKDEVLHAICTAWVAQICVDCNVVE